MKPKPKKWGRCRKCDSAVECLNGLLTCEKERHYQGDASLYVPPKQYRFSDPKRRQSERNRKKAELRTARLEDLKPSKREIEEIESI